MNEEKYLSRMTVENNEVHEKKVVWEIPYNDANLEDWIHAFVTCMVGITFNEQQVLEGMLEYAEERLPKEYDDEEEAPDGGFSRENYD